MKKRIKEHITVCIDKLLNLAVTEKEKNSNKIMIAINRSAIAEQLVNNQSWAENLNFERLKIIKNSYNVFYLVKTEAICTLNRKPVLCRQKEFDFSVALFT